MVAKIQRTNKTLNLRTKVVSFIKHGLFQQLRFYSGNVEVANELYDNDGLLLRRSGLIPDGIVSEYYPNGRVRSKVSFKDGVAHGKGIDYYLSGEVSEESDFERGQLHGASKLYRRNGLLWIETTYCHGRLNGVLRSYHDNGNPETEAEYTDDKLDGSYVKYDKYGCLQEKGTFKRGEKEGNYIIYHENGQPARIERYVEGKLVHCEEFDEDGNMTARTNYE